MTTVFSKEVIFGEVVPDGLLVGELLNLVMEVVVYCVFGLNQNRKPVTITLIKNPQP
jgi:hypothetical protein